jgi:cytochrome c-type biogenesis protein CcmI
MSAGVQILLLVVAVLAATSAVALPFLRPPAQADEPAGLAERDADRARLFAALEELGRDRRSGMISDTDYAAAVGEVRRRLARL